MVKYVVTKDGVKDREEGWFIPNARGNAEWEKYLVWLAAGNTPIPMQPGPAYDLVDDEWVFNLEKQKALELEAAKKAMLERVADYQQLLVDVVVSLLDSGRLKISDLPAETQSIWADLKLKVDTYKSKK